MRRPMETAGADAFSSPIAVMTRAHESRCARQSLLACAKAIRHSGIMSEASTARAPGVAARIDEARRLADSGKILEAEQAFLEILREAPHRNRCAQFRRDLRARARALRAGARAARTRARHPRGRSRDADQSRRDLRCARAARPVDRIAARGAQGRARSFRRAAASCRSARARRSRQRCAAALLRRGLRRAGRGAMAQRCDHRARTSTARAARDALGRGRPPATVLECFWRRCASVTERRRWRASRNVSPCISPSCRRTIPIPRSVRNSSIFRICRPRSSTKRELFPWYATLEGEDAGDPRGDARGARGRQRFRAVSRPLRRTTARRTSRQREWSAAGLERVLLLPPRHALRRQPRRCPETSAALENVPLCHVRDHSPEVLLFGADRGLAHPAASRRDQHATRHASGADRSGAIARLSSAASRTAGRKAAASRSTTRSSTKRGTAAAKHARRHADGYLEPVSDRRRARGADRARAGDRRFQSRGGRIASDSQRLDRSLHF